jgi:hypothetical protein
MLDTTNENFLTELAKHLEKRLATLLSAILEQDIGPRAEELEKRSINGMAASFMDRLSFLDGVERSVEKVGFIDRKAME